ncbi:MAG: hypothetical protein EOO89_09950 [Pedobacter sp.]|nr:MAG: hypothetical protein EOO89_09950 [Pedobacter sp.]
MINSAKNLSQNAKLHEVGIQFAHWNNPWPNGQGRWSFREQYKVGDLTSIKPKFDVRLELYDDTNSPNTILPTTYLTADLRLEWHKNNILVRRDLLGVIFSNPNNYDMNNNSTDAVFWQDIQPANPRIFLHGSMLNLGIPNLQTISTTNYTTIEFDYMPLIMQYLPGPPEGCTYDDAVIVGLDIYSSTRCADVVFSVKNIYLHGTN